MIVILGELKSILPKKKKIDLPHSTGMLYSENVFVSVTITVTEEGFTVGLELQGRRVDHGSKQEVFRLEQKAEC